MTGTRPQVRLACTAEVRLHHINDADLERPERFAVFHGQEFNEEPSWDTAPGASDDVRSKFVDITFGPDDLVVCHGSPRVDEGVMFSSGRLKLVGELDGDRFAQRIAVGAATARGVTAVETTDGSSYPVSEWAIGLALVGLRNVGAHFRRLIAGELERHFAGREIRHNFMASALANRRGE